MPAIIELVTRARQANLVDDILNVFNYYNETVATLSGADQDLLIDDFEANILPAILAFQTDQIVYLEISTRMVNGVTFASKLLGSTDGVISGDPAPPYLCYEFIYKRATAETRNGFKRFAGVDEASVDQGGNVSGAVAAALTAAEPVLAQSISPDGILMFRPVILGDPVPPSIDYRIGEVDEVAFQRVSTQNSRKPWL